MSLEPIRPEYRNRLAADCRDLLYERILAHLSEIDAGWLGALEVITDVGGTSFGEELRRLMEVHEPRAANSEQVKPSDALLAAEEADRELRAVAERIAEETDPKVREMGDRILGAIIRELEPKGQTPTTGPEPQVPQRGLGQAVRVLREEAGLSRRLLAERADLAASQLARIEEGQCDPPWGSVGPIAAGLKVSLRHLSEVAEELEEVGE